jgi:uncharacterized protein (DUF302 family)
MYRRFFLSKWLSAALLLAFAAGLSLPASAQVRGVTIPSHESFQQTVSQLKSAVSHGGMMVLATVNQGTILSMTGLRLKATLFLVGNPTVGKMIFQQDPAVGLYVPFPVYVYQKNGTTYITYDKPSASLKPFGNSNIDKTAQMLDMKLHGLAEVAAK